MNTRIETKIICVIMFIFTFACFNNFNQLYVHAVGSTDYSKIVICIDPGHQSRGNSSTEPIAPGSKTKKAKVSSGTRGVVTKVPEYKLNLKIGLKLEALLKQAGFQVIMTRETNDVDISNIERAMVANNAKANISIRIHADGSTNKNMSGLSILYPAKPSVNKDVFDRSKKAAQIVFNAVTNEASAKGNGIVPRSDLTGFNWSTVPSILIETGFMTNVAEDKKLETNDYEDKIAKGIMNGIKSYFGE